ncbi:MAG: helix-turn-helix domain-containing protein [Moheibacter sp.]
MNSLDVIRIRENLGLTQTEFANLLNVSPRTVQNYEAGGTIPKSKYAILHKLENKNIEYEENDNDVLMLKEEKAQYGSPTNQLQEKERTILFLKDHLKDKEKIIVNYEREVKRLRNDLDDLKHKTQKT